MKERDFKAMGFVKQEVSEKESGSGPYYFYSWEPYVGSNFSFVSVPNDEVENGEWWVEPWDSTEIRLTKKKDVETMMAIMTKNLKANKPKKKATSKSTKLSRK